MGGHGGSKAVAGDTHDGGNKAMRGERSIVEKRMGRGEEVKKNNK